MQMIDVLKRLAELDAANPNRPESKIVKESQQSVEECGMMPAAGMGSHHSPASINITADSGPELSDMLKDIMSLAGMSHDHDHDMEMPVSAPAGMADIDTTRGDDMPGDIDSVGSMRSMIDKMNPDDDQDDDSEVKEYDTTSNPEMTGQPPANQDPAGSPGAAQGRNQMNNPVATPTMEEIEKNLRQEYAKFLSEE
jgi:hypothetical protein